MSPTLSVAIPLYNHEHYIEITLRSILSQSRRPDEVIVVDDGSTDRSAQIVEEIARHESLVRLVRNGRNLGAVGGCRAAAAECRGDYMITFGSDDIFLPGFCERAMEMVTRYPHAGIFSSTMALLDDATGQVKAEPPLFGKSPRFFSPREMAEELCGGYIPGVGTIFKRTAFLATAGFHDGIKWHSDWFYNLVIAFRHGLCYSPENLAANRVRRDSYSAAGLTKPEDQREVIRWVIRLLKSPEFRDVLPLFATSGVLSHFGADIIEAVLETQELCDAETMLLMQVPLWDFGLAMGQRRNRLVQRRQNEGQTTTLQRYQAAMASGDTGEALRALAQLIDVSPGYIQAYLDLAQLLRGCSQHAIARQVLEQAASVNPNETQVFTIMGDLAVEQSDSQGAVWAYERACALDSSNAFLRDRLARLRAVVSAS